MHYEISTPWEDVSTLLAKIQLLNDIISYNCTVQMGKKYQNWVEDHKELMKDLEGMLSEDLMKLEKF